jgi:hypothetical protein
MFVFEVIRILQHGGKGYPVQSKIVFIDHSDIYKTWRKPKVGDERSWRQGRDHEYVTTIGPKNEHPEYFL